MKKQLSKTIFVLLALGLTVPAFASTSLHNIERQQARSIQQGIRSGELTTTEIGILRNEQRSIKNLKRRYQRDGHISHREHRTLRNRYANASRHIYQLKHNRNRRHGHGGRHTPWGHGGYGLLGLLLR